MQFVLLNLYCTFCTITTTIIIIATTLADSYLPASSVTAAAAAEAAASRKEVKYSDLPASFSFQLITVETLGPINESAVDFLRELGRRISVKFQEERQSAYLFQRLSVTVQRFSAVILHDSFPPSSDLWPPIEYYFYYFYLALTLRSLLLRLYNF